MVYLFPIRDFWNDNVIKYNQVLHLNCFYENFFKVDTSLELTNIAFIQILGRFICHSFLQYPSPPGRLLSQAIQLSHCKQSNF